MNRLLGMANVRAALCSWMLDIVDNLFFVIVMPLMINEGMFDLKTGGLFVTVALISSAAGGVLAGGLADAIGRRSATTVFISCYSAAMLLMGTVPYSFAGFLVLRVISGFGLGGTWTAAETWIVESVRGSFDRRAVSSYFQMSGGIGYIAGALLASLVIYLAGWRLLFVIAGGLGGWLLWYVWQRGSETLPAELRRPLSARAVDYRPLLAVRLRRSTLIFLISIILLQAASWGIFSQVSVFLAAAETAGGMGVAGQHLPLYMIIYQTGMWLGAYAVRLFNRRPAAVYRLYCLAGFAVYAGFYLAPAAATFVFLFLSGAAMGVHGIVPYMLSLYYRQEIRSRAGGLIYSLGRGIGGVMPYLNTYLIVSCQALRLPFLLIAAVMLLSGLVLSLLPPPPVPRAAESQPG
ncbi:MAG: MFS transporter [Negativicutes bacterium]|nr:MFS transporter [Negativicutes bacterium]